MATYRSTSPLQVQLDLFADMEKYQPVEFDKNTSTKTPLSSFSFSSRALFFFFSFLLEPGVPPEARRQWLTFHRLARRNVLLINYVIFLKGIFLKKDYSYQTFYQYSTFLSFSTRSKRSSTRRKEASQNLPTRKRDKLIPSKCRHIPNLC